MSRVFCDLRSQITPRGILPVDSNVHLAAFLLYYACSVSGNMISYNYLKNADPKNKNY